MKSTKKVLAVLLATAMLCAICATSVFAVSFSTYYEDDDYAPSCSRSYYHIAEGLVNAKGRLIFTPANRNVTYIVSCRNINYDSLYEYGLVAQCAINYDDGSQDYGYESRNVMIDIGREETLYVNTMRVSPDKTIISLDAEFFVGYNDTVIWEGSIFPEDHILGINA